MSAQELREAAETLRQRATAATQGPWRWEQYRDDLPFLVGRGGDAGTYEWEQEVIEAEHHGECGCRSACHLELTVKREDRDYITTMHPGIGLALARWLDDIAAGWMWDGEEPNVVDFDGDRLTFEESLDTHALKIARVINGDAS